MSHPKGERHIPLSEYVWWTFTPLYATAFIIAAYFIVYAAFINCGGKTCDPVNIRRLLEQRGWCAEKNDSIKHLRRDEERAAAARQSAPPNRASSPTPTETALPSPTPSVRVTTEAEGPAQQVTVQVKLPPVAPTPTPDGPTLEERRVAVYAGRLPWVVVYAVSFITNLFMLLTGLYVVWSSLRERFGKGGRAWALGGVLAAGLLLSLVPWALATEENMPVLVPLINCLLKVDLTGALDVVALGNGFAFGVSGVAVLASCAALWPVGKPREQAVAEIAGRMSYLRALLYVGMIALVVSILRMTALFHWALAFLPSPDDDRAAQLIARVTSNVTSGEAAAYTLLLAAIYVPAAFVLRRRARALIPPEKVRVKKSQDGKEGKVQSGEEWLEEHGLTVAGSLQEILPKLAAILAPLLVGSVGELLKGLGSISQ